MDAGKAEDEYLTYQKLEQNLYINNNVGFRKVGDARFPLLGGTFRFYHTRA